MSKALWMAKIAEVKAQPYHAFDIVTWNGVHKNVQADILDVSYHLATCPHRHSEAVNLVREGRKKCNTLW